MTDNIVGKFLIWYTDAQNIETDIVSFSKIIAVDHDKITFMHAKVIKRGEKWYPSDELTNKTSTHKLIYARNRTLAKRKKLQEQAIKDLRLPFYTGRGLKYPEIGQIGWITDDDFELRYTLRRS